MDARRFDAFARALSRAPSRRQFVKSLPLLAAGVATLRPSSLLADTGAVTGVVGGVVVECCLCEDPTVPVSGVAISDGTVIQEPTTPVDTTTPPTTPDTPTTPAGGVVCLPIAQTGEDPSLLPPFSATIVTGSCDVISDDVVFELLDVGADDDVEVAVPPAVFMSRSVTTIRAPLEDLTDERHSIVIRDDEGNVISCGEIGGVLQGDELAAGLRERTNSGYSGVSLLRATNGSTLVYIFLGRGMSSITTAPVGGGSTVETTADVNLRRLPAADSEVLTVIPAGTTLQITGAAVGEWVLVEDPSSGLEGYVSAQFVQAAG
jgi:hypothetical protein